MVITREYLLLHRTDKGSWTKAQFDILGLSWPPRKNWISLIVNKEVTDEQAKRFEEAKYIGSHSLLAKIKSYTRKLHNKEVLHLIEWMKRL
jgi:hypothetical protein